MFGWLPALIWILVGSIFIGGVHDFTSLVASDPAQVRDRSPRWWASTCRGGRIVLFLAFIWISLVYIIVAFTDVTAASFVGSTVTLENGETRLGRRDRHVVAPCTLLIPVAMGLFDEATPSCLSQKWATVIFVPLVGPGDLGRSAHPVRSLDRTFGLERPDGAEGLGRRPARLLLRGLGDADVAPAPASRPPGRLFPLPGDPRRRDSA